MEAHQQPRRRRKSSIQGELRGDTGGPALATIRSSHLTTIPPTPSPTLKEHRRSGRFARARRKGRRLLLRWKRMSFRHTWVNPLIVLLCFIIPFLINPSEENPIHDFLLLSYPLPPPGPRSAHLPFSSRNAIPSNPSNTWTYRLHDIQYGKGPKDVLFVTFYIVLLSFFRESVMQLLLRPLAIRYFGIPRNSQKLARFMEQAYTAIYFSISSPVGLYVMKNSPLWFFETRPMFEGFPHTTHSAVFKAYYLVQAAYWMQQALVLMLQLEKPRKDFKELVAHHLITLGLIASSYRYNFTYMGLAVYIIHDVSDFFLATSKVLNYLGSTIVGPYFFIFMITWIYFRHYLMILILYAVLTDFATVGPFTLDASVGQYKYWVTQYITFGLLGSLQAVNLFWLYLILRIAKTYVWQREEIVDVRSDDEDGSDTEGDVGSSVAPDGGAGEKSGLKGKAREKEIPQLRVNDEPIRRRNSGRRNAAGKQEPSNQIT